MRKGLIGNIIAGLIGSLPSSIILLTNYRDNIEIVKIALLIIILTFVSAIFGLYYFFRKPKRKTKQYPKNISPYLLLLSTLFLIGLYFIWDSAGSVKIYTGILLTVIPIILIMNRPSKKKKIKIDSRKKLK